MTNTHLTRQVQEVCRACWISLDYHIPAVFDTRRESVASGVEHHLVGSKLPLPTTRPSVVSQSALPQWSPWDSDTPTSTEHFLYSDLPQLTVRVMNFDNTTPLNANFSHTFVDRMAFSALFVDWVAVLENRVSMLHLIATMRNSGSATELLGGVGLYPFGISRNCKATRLMAILVRLTRGIWRCTPPITVYLKC